MYIPGVMAWGEGGGGERVFDEQPMTRLITLQFEEQYEWTLHIAVHRMNHNE